MKSLQCAATNAICHHIRPHTRGHFFLVKGVISILVLAAILYPSAAHIAVAANMAWIWIDP